MSFVLTAILAVLCAGILTAALLRQIFSLKKKVLQLQEEVGIQSSRLNSQKKQYSDSTNYFCSAVVIIMEMVREIDNALKSKEGDLSEKVLQILFEKAKGLLKPQKCVLFKIDAEKNTFSHLYAFGFKDEELPGESFLSTLDVNNSFLGWSVASGRFLSLEDAEQDQILRHLISNDPLQCHYAQPLKVDNKVKAVLCMGSLSAEIEKEAVAWFFSILSNTASVALSDAMLTQDLRERSIRDSLTGVYNHSYFQKWLEISLGSLKEKAGVLSVVMVDMDYFKRVNDTYGHQTGDIVLKTISGLFNNLQVSDYICARYGGDEFAFVFRGKDASQARLIMEDARERVAQKAFELDGEAVRITVSAGIAEARFLEAEKINQTELIKSADQALYRAKAEGRNRVIVF